MLVFRELYFIPVGYSKPPPLMFQKGGGNRSKVYLQVGMARSAWYKYRINSEHLKNIGTLYFAAVSYILST